MSVDNSEGRASVSMTILVIVLAAAGAVALALLVLGGPVDILKGAMCSGATCNGGQLQQFIQVADSLDNPASAAIGSISVLGVLTGGAMLGIAHPSATKVLATSAGTGLVVVLARGIIT